MQRTMVTYLFKTLMAFGFCVGAVAPALAKEPIEGVWMTMVRSEVTIAACDVGYCGYLSKVVVPPGKLTPEQAAGAEIVDFRNKDPKLRNRPMLGLQILSLNPSTKPGVYAGEVYNPEDGNTYSGFIKVLGPDQVRLEGCVLFNIICRGEDWALVSK